MNAVIKDVIDNKWSRGSILLSSGNIEGLPNGEFVVITHDCDITHHILENEPNIELLLLVPIENVDGNLTNLKNLRKLHISVETSKHFELTAKNYYQISKDKIVGIQPVSKLDEETIDIVIRWRRGRLDRSALPDAFNNRLKINDFNKKLERKLKPLKDLIIDLYVQLNTELELLEDIDYRIRLLILVKIKNVQTESLIEWIVENIPSSIVVEDDYRTAIKKNVDLEEFEGMKKLWLDYLS